MATANPFARSTAFEESLLAAREQTVSRSFQLERYWQWAFEVQKPSRVVSEPVWRPEFGWERARTIEGDDTNAAIFRSFLD